MWSSLNLKYFRADSTLDNWGDPSKISPQLLLKLDKLREKLGSRLIVTSGYRSDNPNSQHYYGHAADIMFPDTQEDLFDLWLLAERVGFNGIGIYPHWKYQGVALGGLHVDLRLEDARWMGVMENNSQIYLPLNKFNLQRYGII